MDELKDIDLGGLNVIQIDNRKYDDMWRELAKVEGFSEYLEETKALDMKRYFYVPPASQTLVRGHYNLADYFSKVLKYYKENKTDKALDKEE